MFPKKKAVVRIEEDGFRYAFLEGALGGRLSEEGIWSAPSGPADEAPPALFDLLTEALKENGVGRVRLELPLGRAVLHLLDLPPMKRADARRAVPFELERRMPISLENFFWSWVSLRRDSGGTRVLTAAVRRSFLSPYLESLSAAGILVASVEFSLLRILLAGGREDALYTEKTASGIDMALLSKGELVLAKTFEADFAGEQQRAAFGNAVDQELREFRAEKVVFRGQRVAVDAERLRERLPENILVETDESAFLSAGKVPRSKRLDVLPEEFRVRRDVHKAALIVLVTLATLSFVLPGILRGMKSRQALEQVNADVEALRSGAEVASGTLREQERLLRSIKVLRPFFAGRNRPLLALEELSRIVPKDTWLVNYSMDEKGKIEIDGYSARSSEIVGLLEDSSRFSGVELAGPVLMQDLGQHFSIKMFWEAVGGEE